MSDYTPTDGEVLTAVVLYRAIASVDAPPPPIETIATPEETARYLGEYQRWLAEHDAKVRAEEREKANREPSEEAVEKAAIAIGRQESCVNPKTGTWYSDVREATRDRFRGYAHTALLAAQEVRNRGD